MKSCIFWILVLGLFTHLPTFYHSQALAGGVPLKDLLADTQWQWTKSSYNNDTEAVPKNPEKYFISFDKDGIFSGLADCNRIRGSYSLSKSKITMGPIISTRAMCPAGSLDITFLKDLERAAIIFFKENALYIDLAYHSGTMAFVPAQDQTADTKKGTAIVCKDPRPDMCTMEYDPVCGQKKDTTQKTYSNGCQACSDSDVISYRKGECP